MVSASKFFLNICRSHFLQAFWSCLDLVVLFRQLDVVCHFSWRVERIFQCHIIIIIIIYSLRVFTSVIAVDLLSGVWVIASLLKSPGLFSVFWPFGWSPLVLLFLSPSVPLTIPWWLPKAPIKIGIISYSIVFFFNSQGRGTYPSFHFLSILLCGEPGQRSPQFCKFSFFLLLLIIIRSGRLIKIRWFVCMLKCHRSLCVSSSGTDAGLCIYNLFIWSNMK